MRLTGHQVLKFDAFLPLYNWIYPISGRPSTRFTGDLASEVFSVIGPARSRALYVHIPFCETICSFCPFIRGTNYDGSVVDAYVGALVHEIEMKASVPGLCDTPVGAIFFGGGTPSVLEPRHIREIGRALNTAFDLSRLREFSFEFEVKSVTPERVTALLEIGVTHARFGAQTFTSEYRALFDLTASLEQVSAAAELLRTSFPHASCDVLYGMNGQTEEDLLYDIDAVCSLELDNVDFYPINNLVTQPKLHRAFLAAGKRPVSGLTKYYMGILVREALRAQGYLPHNGHGYVRVPKDEIERNPVVTDHYSFVYHEHTLGYPGCDLLGFGTNAVSSFARFTVSNLASRDGYIRALADGHLPVRVSEHDEAIDACRPISLALAYHGAIPVDWVNEASVPNEVMERLREVIDHGLIVESGDQFQLTRSGWEWYPNVMYYLLPPGEKRAINGVLLAALRDHRRDIEGSGLDGFPFASATSTVGEAANGH